MQSCRPIMLVEDDNIDAMTATRAMKDLHVTNELVRACDGEQALDYLGNNRNRMPWDLKTIPVIVLTTSGEQRDIAESFKLGVAGYMVKSVDYTKFKETMRLIDEYWTLSEMPEQLDRVQESQIETGITG